MSQRSTKGASKQRRDAINERIGEIRELLPVSEAVRSRLSQLQVMALANSFIAKSNFFTNQYSNYDDRSSAWNEHYDFGQAAPGFLLIIGLDGKILYISDNVAEYLGNSAVDTMTQTETVFDLIHEADQEVLRHAMQEVESTSQEDWFCGGQMTGSTRSDWLSFSCRMNTAARNIRYVAAPTKTSYTRSKMMQVRGRFIQSRLAYGCGRQQWTAFVAFCSPHINAVDSMEPFDDSLVACADTMVFRSLHQLDMKFLKIESNGEYHLGYDRSAIYGKSWYEMLHPEDAEEARRKHVELIRACEIGDTNAKRALCVRVLLPSGDVTWLHVIMRICAADDGNDVIGGPVCRDSLIVCVNRVVDGQQALSIRQHIYRDEMAEIERNKSSAASPSSVDFELQLFDQVTYGSHPSSGYSSSTEQSAAGSRSEVISRLKRKVAHEASGTASPVAQQKAMKYSAKDDFDSVFSMPSPPLYQFNYNVQEVEPANHATRRFPNSFPTALDDVISGPSSSLMCETFPCMTPDSLTSLERSLANTTDDMPFIPESFLTPARSPISSEQSPSPVPSVTVDDSFLTPGPSPVHTGDASVFLADLDAVMSPGDSSFFDVSAEMKPRLRRVVPTPRNLCTDYKLPELDCSSVSSVLECLEQDQCCRGANALRGPPVTTSTSHFQTELAANGATAMTDERIPCSTSAGYETIGESLLQEMCFIGQEFMQSVTGRLAEWNGLVEPRQLYAESMCYTQC